MKSGREEAVLEAVPFGLMVAGYVTGGTVGTILSVVGVLALAGLFTLYERKTQLIIVLVAAIIVSWCVYLRVCPDFEGFLRFLFGV